MINSFVLASSFRATMIAVFLRLELSVFLRYIVGARLSCIPLARDLKRNSARLPRAEAASSMTALLPPCALLLNAIAD